ncbi:MAG: L-serine ammonia-lyase, iron-sulfur-dependent, subunit alpha [Lachnospiraceae bacterium]|nr:L-serine ammonia-lyase, iron-sulfur-dependent, subunit alpha [Lachnospiraceae bacterium]
MAFTALEEILKVCEEREVSFPEAIIQEDMRDRAVSREVTLRQMEDMWGAMYEASQSYEANRRSDSGLIGGAGGQMEAYVKEGRSLCGERMGRVMAGALQMGESNACMKRIVAAPTAGACGVLPAVLVPLYQEGRISRKQVIEALFVAAGIGQVIASRAFISGAAGGCQAEIGSASAMAAGALVCVSGGTGGQMVTAAAISLKNLLGLVCDPVAGLVEVPCVKRNVIGAVNAMAAADMALAGIDSRIPPDQVIDAMKEVGEAMHVSLRETGVGGLAGTKAGREIFQQLSKKESAQP